ncbi:hypothetical protein C2W64_04778 [Brevibacillus laterosporus]|nr:hypothetical protein C2W64_04778 [Brevibacillus laterosporus]
MLPYSVGGVTSFDATNEKFLKVNVLPSESFCVTGFLASSIVPLQDLLNQLVIVLHVRLSSHSKRNAAQPILFACHKV